MSDFGGGTATYQLAKPLQCNYASGGNNHAQIQRVPQYTDCSVSGTMTPLSGWNGSSGGIFAVMCNGTMNVSGNIAVDGLGYRGGIGARKGDGHTGQQGESYTGLGIMCYAYNCFLHRSNNGGGGGSGGEYESIV